MPWPVYVLLVPIEFLSTIIIRPITLTLRLQLNMFAGHLVLVLCVLGGAYMATASGALPYLSWVGLRLRRRARPSSRPSSSSCRPTSSFCLSAIYIGGALVDEH